MMRVDAVGWQFLCRFNIYNNFKRKYLASRFIALRDTDPPSPIVLRRDILYIVINGLNLRMGDVIVFA